MKTLISTILISIAILLSVNGFAEASNVLVDGEYAAYSSIQEAINSASKGDIIEVHSGTYRENVVINKSIILRGIGEPIIDAGGIGCGVILEADGITLEGFNVTNSEVGILSRSNRNLISGNFAFHNQKGICLLGSTGNIIRENIVRFNIEGIELVESFENRLIENVADHNAEGIYLCRSGGNILRNNTMHLNGINFGALGDGLFELDNDIDISNLADGSRIYYLVGISDLIIDSNSQAGAIYSIGCRNITMQNLNLSQNSVGIYLYRTYNCAIENCTIKSNLYGIKLDESYDNIIRANTFRNSRLSAIFLGSSKNNNLQDNYVASSYDGIYLGQSSSNILQNNQVKDNANYGIKLYNSNRNLIDENEAHNNYIGINLEESKGNTLRANQMSENWINFDIAAPHLDNDIDTSNKVNGKAIFYLVGQSDALIDSSSAAGAVYCIDCSNITLRDLELEGNGMGISFQDTKDSAIHGCHIRNNWKGIVLSNSCRNLIERNDLISNKFSSIVFQNSHENTIRNNYICNEKINIFIHDSRHNLIYLNDFIGQACDFWIEDNTNKLNSSQPLSYLYEGDNSTSYTGNYWSEYRGTDEDRGGIGDLPFIQDEKIRDHYPLIQSSDKYLFEDLPGDKEASPKGQLNWIGSALEEIRIYIKRLGLD